MTCLHKPALNHMKKFVIRLPRRLVSPKSDEGGSSAKAGHSSFAFAILYLPFSILCSAQPALVDQSTPHMSGSNTYYGDNLFTAFSKANANTTNFDIRLTTCSNSIVIFSNQLAGANAALGAVSNNFLAVSNNFVAVSNEFVLNGGIPVDSNGNGHWGTNGLDLVYVPSLYYGIGNNGINDGSSPDIGFNGFVLENTTQSLCDFAWAVLDDDGGSFYTSLRLETRGGYVLTGGAKELQFGNSGTYIGSFGYLPNLLLGDAYATSTLGFSIGEGNSPTAPPSNGLHVVGNVQFDSAFSSDSGNFTSDGSGNVTAQTFTPLSDRTLKENITPIQPGSSLAMVMALTNYQWNFKARTNFTQTVTRQTNSAATNLVAKSSPATTNSMANSITAKAGLILTTNLTPKVLAASGKQFGPMAQDWHAVTGLDDGRHISTTAMQGLLLGAMQDLNQKVTMQETLNGRLYPSNTWNLSAITNAMPNFSIWTGNSNGMALVTISLSNGVVRYLQTLQ